MLKVDWNIVFNMINVFVLYLLMKKFLFGPVTKIMEERKNVINASFAEAKKANTEALSMKQEYEQTLQKADEKAEAIIKEAKQRALEEHDKQLIIAKQETGRMIEEAKKMIDLERRQSMQNIQSEVAGIAMLAATKVIQKNVDNSTNKELIEDFLAEAGAGK